MNCTHSKTPNKFSYINISYCEIYLFPLWQRTGQDSFGSPRTEKSLKWLTQKKEFTGHRTEKGIGVDMAASSCSYDWINKRAL